MPESSENQLLLLLSVLCAFLLLVFIRMAHLKFQKVAKPLSHKPEDVKDFYNKTTDKFLEVYGQIIQAFRTHNVEDYLNYTAEKIGFSKMEKVLDAGCGVAGPAVHFAKQFQNLKIDAITISEVQVEKAKLYVDENNLGSQISISLVDYHQMSSFFEKESYDAVYFLESFGHSPNQEYLLEEAIQLIKPGGKIYIKDLFKRESKLDWEQQRIDEICEEINKAYEYQIPTLNNVLSTLRKNEMILNFVGVPEVASREFENLSISNDFQELFGIGKIETWQDYIFPIDFYEIVVQKPIIKDKSKLHLYFLNNQGEKTS